MQHLFTVPYEMFTSIWKNRFLIRITTIREIQNCYRGSLMGLSWSLIKPLFMLSTYTLFFNEFFQTRWYGGSNASKGEFALVLFAGLIIFNFFSECLNKAPQLIVANVNYVKKVAFPLEILPIISLGSALFHAIISIFVWLIAYYKFFGIPHLTVIYFPLILIPLIIMLVGISWVIASLGVFLRDINQFIALFTNALMFLSPIFYSADILPLKFRQLMYLNPLTVIIEQTRNTLYWGKCPDFFALLVYWIFAFVIAWIGFLFFHKTSKGFADVL